ncbi:fused MFS/spermidine synthase [Hamadaea sp. NPDC051192]|uniref:fused MFS/spermidine synthase n=1 Tax=Hamadaea sp. NPDC051192 TaxID=3154940 RepID=UPI0034386E07
MGDVYVIETGVVELVEDPDEPDAWTLVVNGMPQSHVNLADPVMIAFDYVRRSLKMVELTLPAGPLRVLHLGGGGLSLPRCLSLLRPGSEQTVVEIDPLLADLVAEKLPLHPDSGITVTIGDAKDALAAAAPQEYDLIIADVFTGSAVPRHVTNAQFVKLAAAALAPGGLYLANVIDGRPLIFLRGLIQAVRDAFGDTVVAAEEDVFAEQLRGNFLVTGSDRDLRVLTELPEDDPYDLVVKRGKELSRFLAGEMPNR